MAARGLDIGFLLDRQRHVLSGEMETSKRPALLALARVLAETRTPYAIVGGKALQVHRAERRTTLDTALAVPRFGAIPRAALRTAGFEPTGNFAHSDNWLGPQGVPVQFTDDQALTASLERAQLSELDGVPLRVIWRSDLLHEKLRAGSDTARRHSKSLQDLAHAEALLEEDPTLRAELSEDERSALDSLPE